MKNSPVKKIAFLDRDGVINRQAPPHEYITRAEDFIFNPGIFAVLEKLKGSGYEFIILTNQRGIARGKMSEADLADIHGYMLEVLKTRGIGILDIFYCPHEENTCDCRKPKDGLLVRAAGKYRLDRTRSIIITDSPAEVEMGKRFGLGGCYFVNSGHPEELKI